MPDVAISCQTTGDPHVATLLGMTLSLSSCLAPPVLGLFGDYL